MLRNRGFQVALNLIDVRQQQGQLPAQVRDARHEYDPPEYKDPRPPPSFPCLENLPDLNDFTRIVDSASELSNDDLSTEVSTDALDEFDRTQLGGVSLYDFEINRCAKCNAEVSSKIARLYTCPCGLAEYCQEKCLVSDMEHREDCLIESVLDPWSATALLLALVFEGQGFALVLERASAIAFRWFLLTNTPCL